MLVVPRVWFPDKTKGKRQFVLGCSFESWTCKHFLRLVSVRQHLDLLDSSVGLLVLLAATSGSEK